MVEDGVCIVSIRKRMYNNIFSKYYRKYDAYTYMNINISVHYINK